MSDLSEMERGLVHILGQCFAYSREPMLRAYMLEGIAWAVKMAEHRRHWQNRALEAQEDWFRPDPEDERETALRAWLQGE